MKPLIVFLLFTCLSLTLNAQNEMLSVSVVDDTVTIFNYGAHENCTAKFKITNESKEPDPLILIETDTIPQKMKCMCNFDITMTLTNLYVGTHEAFVYRRYLKKYNYQNDTLIFIGRVSFNILNIAGNPPILNAAQSDCYQTTNIGLDIILPNEITLEAYPNPTASGNFVLRYSLTKSEHVLLKLFDSVGKEVTTLVDDRQLAGNHEFHFQKNTSITSGIYYCTLITETKNKTTRIVIEK